MLRLIKAKFNKRKVPERKVETRMKRLVERVDYLYFKPTKPIVSEVRSNLLLDKKGFNRIYTKNLYNNTRAEILQQDKRNLYLRVKIGLGHFVPYGKNLETGGSPRKVPLPRLIDWVKKKFGVSTDALAYPRALGVQKKIRASGSDPSDILKDTWVEQEDNYVAEVTRRIQKIWR